jgi:receptor protein-tyrosine kinase
MSQDTNRLQLIQRAAQRLIERNTGRGSSSPQVRDPVPAADSIKIDPVLAHKTDYSTTAPQQNETYIKVDRSLAETTKPSVSRRVRMNFAELRRMGMVTPDNMTSEVSYEYRNIKRKLLTNARDPKTGAVTNNLLMITSALPGEGKTFTAVNLALSLAAERDLHVLLIDGDVIHPTIGTLFDRPNEHGLTDLLSGNCQDVSDVLYRCEDMPNLSVIFAGKSDKNTPELLSSRKMADICLEMSKRYNDRIIIIDSPPVLACSEPASIAMHVHQVILVVAAAQTTRSQVRAALENVSACPSVSVLFNKAPQWQKIEGESYYYYGVDRAAAQ